MTAWPPRRVHLHTTEATIERRELAAPSIACPVCGRISHHPDDVREGYCGACHDWTTPR